MTRYYVTVHSFIGEIDGYRNGSVFIEQVARALRKDVASTSESIIYSGDHVIVGMVVESNSKRAARHLATEIAVRTFYGAAGEVNQDDRPEFWTSIQTPFDVVVNRLSKPSRFMYWSPREVTDPWLPRVFRGSDEHHNRSVGIVVPPFGCFTLFFDRDFDRSVPHPNSWEGTVPNVPWVSGCRICIEMREAFETTPGQVMSTLMAEAQERGDLDGSTFGNSLDC
jgi:hypothetical protein